jgi:hypothetical protein
LEPCSQYSEALLSFRMRFERSYMNELVGPRASMLTVKDLVNKW